MTELEKLRKRVHNSRQRGGHSITLSVQEAQMLIEECDALCAQPTTNTTEPVPLEIHLVGEPF